VGSPPGKNNIDNCGVGGREEKDGVGTLIK
jgi:hypothetical protein